MLGIGSILWRQIVERHYPGRGLGDNPPIRRAILMTDTLAMSRPASRDYYSTVDRVTWDNRMWSASAMYGRKMQKSYQQAMRKEFDNLTNPS